MCTVNADNTDIAKVDNECVKVMLVTHPPPSLSTTTLKGTAYSLVMLKLDVKAAWKAIVSENRC